MGNLPVPVRSGYTFDGWYNNNMLITPYTVYTYTDNLTLTAKWAAGIYTLIFNANGGTVTPASINVTYNEEVGELPIPMREGYLFDGWYNGSTLYVASTLYMRTGNITLVAYWKSLNSISTTNPEASFNVYPNPTKGIVHIATNGNLSPEVRVYTIQGQLVSTFRGTEIDLSGLSNGVYVLQVEDQRVRIVKQ